VGPAENFFGPALNDSATDDIQIVSRRIFLFFLTKFQIHANIEEFNVQIKKLGKEDAMLFIKIWNWGDNSESVRRALRDGILKIQGLEELKETELVITSLLDVLPGGTHQPVIISAEVFTPGPAPNIVNMVVRINLAHEICHIAKTFAGGRKIYVKVKAPNPKDECVTE
jgi:hypothetical protein